MSFAGPQLAHLLRGMDQRLDLGSRVARGDVTDLVAQEPVTNLPEYGSLLEDVNGA